MENEAAAVVAIGVPIFVFETLRRLAIDQKIAAAIMIQAADDVKQRCFAAARRPKDCNKSFVWENQGKVFDRDKIGFVDWIYFFNVTKL